MAKKRNNLGDFSTLATTFNHKKDIHASVPVPKLGIIVCGLLSK